MLTRGYTTVRPGLVFHGHHHSFLDSVEASGHGADAFEARVIGLGRDFPNHASLAVLDVKGGGEIRFYASVGGPVEV